MENDGLRWLFWRRCAVQHGFQLRGEGVAGKAGVG